jgi:pimeloyl-ACP methyl ester carboxylesterase
LPVALFRAEKGNGKLTIYIHGDGFAAEAGAGGVLDKLALAGNTVLAVDLRGMGETAPGKPSAKPGLFGRDFKEAFLALQLNRPLLGQRVHDLLRAVDHWAKEYQDIEVHAVGSAGPIALHAAALDNRIAKLTLDKSLISWQNVVETPICHNQLASAVPRALSVYDLPDLAAMIAPRLLLVRGAVDARGQPVSSAELISTYRVCRERYGQLHADKNFVLEAAR